MAKATRKLSLVLATVFTAFTMLSAATPALGVAKKKVTKKATHKVVAHKKVAHKKVVTVKKPSVSAATVSYNNALAAVKVAEGAFKYDMTNNDNISYAKVKADLAQSKIELVTDSAKQAYLGSRLSVVENKIATAENNYAAAQAKKEADAAAAAALAAQTKGAVTSITALNNTTMVVKFAAAQAVASAADYTFDNSLTVTAAAVKQDDATSVVLTTSSQDSTKTYKLSYKGADTGLTATGMAVATTPAAIALTTSNTMGTLGTNVTLTATVTPASAGVPVTFNVICDDSTKATINTPIVKEVLTDAKGVATITYTRYYGAQDDLRVYPTGSPAIGATGNVYWGSSSRLSVKVTSTSASVTNSAAVIYQITYLDSTGSAEKNKLINVMLKENMNASGSTANVVNLSTGYVSMNQNLYQRDQISDANALALQTDSNGIATFQITGSNTVATPIIYTDETNNNNVYAAGTEDYTHGNFKATTKLDPKFLQITAPSATFSGGTFTITCDKTTGQTVTGVTGKDLADDFGTTYTITVKKADGTADANDTVSVGLQEWMTSGTGTSQEIAAVANNGALSVWNAPTWANGSTKVALVSLNSAGQASFNVVGQTANLLATPIVWKDFNNNNLVDNGEASYTCATSLFVTPAANGMSLSGRDIVAGGNGVTTETSLASTPLWLRARITDQSGNMYSPAGQNIVTFTIQNTGSHPATLKAYSALVNGVNTENIASWLVNGNATNQDYTIAANSTTTVVATSINGSSTYVQVLGDYVGGNGTTLSVQASINDQKDGNYYSVPATVFTFVSPNAVPQTAQTVTYTGTVTGFSTTTGVTTPSRVILKLDGSGDAQDLKYFANDTYALGTDFTNVSYIPVATFAADLSVNDRIQALVTFRGDGTYSTYWKLINVDGSSDSSVDVVTVPNTTNYNVPAVTYFTNTSAKFDGMLSTEIKATCDASVAKVDILKADGSAVLTGVAPAANAIDSTVIGLAKGDVLTLKAYKADNSVLGTSTVTVQ